MYRDRNKVNILCFYWQGSPSKKSTSTHRPGWNDIDLAQEYITKLYNGFARNTTIDFDFYCLTDADVDLPGIKTLPLLSLSHKGCLPKYAAFNPEYGFEGQIFACDLDMVVTGSCDDILSYRGPLATRCTFRGKKESGGDLVTFRAGAYSWIWEEFVQNPEYVLNWTQGKERWMYRYHPRLEGHVAFLQDIFPDQIYSYRNHVRKTGLPERARLVSFHGGPRPHEVQEDWVKEHWR